MADKNYFTELNSINVNDKCEKKNNLTYLSWAYAWGEVKKLHPDAQYKVYEDAQGRMYHTDGKTAWVKCSATVNGIEHIEYLPVMDYKNASIPLERVTSFDANKSVQRCLTKAIARHGLGLYIYAGEDLPDAHDTDAEQAQPAAPAKKAPAKAPKPEPAKPAAPAQPEPIYHCSDCSKVIEDTKIGDSIIKRDVIIASTTKTFGRCLCTDCATKAKQQKAGTK